MELGHLNYPSRSFQSGSTQGTIRFTMPTQSYLAIPSYSCGHGVDPAQAKLIGMNEGNSELKDVNAIFKKTECLNRDFCLSCLTKDETCLEN
jgi:hypothetical protein